jgi:hypothetical protein
MKVVNIKKSINEAINNKLKMDEESHFEGHNFVTYGKNITTVDIDMPLVKINKESLIIKWIGKLELHNDGVYGFAVDVKSMTADSEEDPDSQTENGPLNFNGFEFVVKKVKNPEAADVQVFIEHIFVSTKEKKIYVEFII